MILRTPEKSVALSMNALYMTQARTGRPWTSWCVIAPRLKWEAMSSEVWEVGNEVQSTVFSQSHVHVGFEERTAEAHRLLSALLK